MEKWDWSAIIAAIAVLISLYSLWLQRKDLKKQSKYQRDTFELQNRINSDNIIFSLAGDIIGNIQTQEQIMKNLYLVTNSINILKKDKLSYIKHGILNDFDKDKFDNIEIEIPKSEEYIEQLNKWRKDLTNEITSKGNTLQFQMSGENTLAEIIEIMDSFKETLKQISDDCENLLRDSKPLNTKEMQIKLNDLHNRVSPSVTNLQRTMVKIKSISLDKLSKIG